MLGNQAFVKDEMKIEERGNAGEIIMYRKRVVEVLKRPLKCAQWKEQVPLY